MREKLILSAIGLAIASSSVHAQTELSIYADANGYIDVQKLTCAQLAGTFQEDGTCSPPGTAAGITASRKSISSFFQGQKVANTN